MVIFLLYLYCLPSQISVGLSNSLHAEADVDKYKDLHVLLKLLSNLCSKDLVTHLILIHLKFISHFFLLPPWAKIFVLSIQCELALVKVRSPSSLASIARDYIWFKNCPCCTLYLSDLDFLTWCDPHKTLTFLHIWLKVFVTSPPTSVVGRAWLASKVFCNFCYINWLKHLRPVASFSGKTNELVNFLSSSELYNTECLKKIGNWYSTANKALTSKIAR